MHYWGDKDVDWKGINDAAWYIQDYCSKWGRMTGHGKEKYGTVRYYGSPTDYVSLHQLMYPLYMRSRFPSWLWKLDIMVISSFLTKVFGKVIFTWQKFIYNKAYQNALHKWPHLRAEILVDADWLEYIEGVTRIEGHKTHVIGWDGEILATWSRTGQDGP